MTVEKFLNSNPDLVRSEDELHSLADVYLSVTVRGISDSFVEFVYMGQGYRADRKEVRSLEELKNSSLGAKAATITLNRDAVLLAQRAVSAKDVVNSTPFGFERLSPAFMEDNRQSPREIAWLQMTGYNNDAVVDSGNGVALGGTFSTSTSCPRPTRDDQQADQVAHFLER